MAQEQDSEARSKIAPWAHVLAVRDIDVSARYFCEIPGFALEWPEAQDWRLVRRDGVRIMLGKCPKCKSSDADRAAQLVRLSSR